MRQDHKVPVPLHGHTWAGRGTDACSCSGALPSAVPATQGHGKLTVLTTWPMMTPGEAPGTVTQCLSGLGSS